MRRKSIPYNPKLKELAGKLRKEMTFPEVKLWKKLRTGGMMDHDVDRQRPIANYIIDFYCKDSMLAIEVDGMTHDDEAVSNRVIIRQNKLENLGISVIRFSALQVVHDIKNVTRAIEHWIIDYKEKFGVLCILQRSVCGREPNPPWRGRGGRSQTVLHIIRTSPQFFPRSS